jgi:hypothetical protein
VIVIALEDSSAIEAKSIGQKLVNDLFIQG